VRVARNELEPGNRQREPIPACALDQFCCRTAAREAREVLAGLAIEANRCMEDDARSTSPSSVSTYPAVSEDAIDAHIDPRRTLDLHHIASSSPDLNLKIKPSLPSLANVGLSRTRTLPLRSPRRSISIFPTLQGISFEVENVERLRRWVLGLAIGDYCLLV
jgi:hypothetical protein